jgi:hypothetical protein
LHQKSKSTVLDTVVTKLHSHHCGHTITAGYTQPKKTPVEAAGGFVQEQHTRVCDEGDADVGALGLAATDALGEEVTYPPDPNVSSPNTMLCNTTCASSAKPARL